MLFPKLDVSNVWEGGNVLSQYAVPSNPANPTYA